MKMSAVKKIIESENKKWPPTLKLVPEHQWPTVPQKGLFKVWRSRHFIVQVYQAEKAIRLSVNRTMIRGDWNYAEGITWEELQALKDQCGYGDRCGVEIYPPNKDVVNVANMRHLWILDNNPEYMWREK